MKLSMEILKHHLQQYHPVATITSKEPTIAGVKLFSYAKNPEPDFLYVGHNNDFFYGSESRDVLLVHREDVMVLSTTDLEDVFNDITECFAYYSSWEQDMLSACNSANPEQAIIDACKDVFGPMFFTTMSLQITGISSQYPKGSINRNWDDFLETGTLSVERFLDMKSGSYMEKHNSIWNCELFYETQVERYPYSLMISQVSLNGKLTGQLTIISETPFEPYITHLAPAVKKALCHVTNNFLDGDRGSVVQSVFLDLIKGSKKESTIRKFNDLMGWEIQQKCVVAVLKNRHINHVSFGYDMDLLRKEFQRILFCVNDDDSLEHEIVCCIPVPETSENNEVGKFLSFIRRFGFEVGVSFVFEDAENLDIQYLQAKKALQTEKESFYLCAMYELVGLKGTAAYRRAAIHPAIFRILQYDETKGTDYYHMLEVFLHNERDRVKTAEELFVHKNTLVYRLKKMEEMFGLQLDDAYDREYLLISLNCMKNF